MPPKRLSLASYKATALPKLPLFSARGMVSESAQKASELHGRLLALLVDSACGLSWHQLYDHSMLQARYVSWFVEQTAPREWQTCR